MIDDEAFKQRILRQGWCQGSLIPWRGELARQIAEVGVRHCDLRVEAGAPTLEGEEPDGHFLLISQMCDLTAPSADEPFACALPAGLYDPDPDSPLPLRNSARWLVLERPERIAARQARLITFAKELLPDQQAVQPPVASELVATWCARRWRRTPHPDDFARTIQLALEDALKRVRNEEALGATMCWRVEYLLPNDQGQPSVSLIAVFDPNIMSATRFADYVNAVTTEVDQRRGRYDSDFARKAPEHVPYFLGPSQPMSVRQLDVQTAIDFPMISFDHLSPDPGDMEPEGQVAPELREEDIF